MNATVILLVALPVAGAAIGAAGIWLSKRSMPSRRVPTVNTDVGHYTYSPEPKMREFSRKDIAVHHG